MSAWGVPSTPASLDTSTLRREILELKDQHRTLQREVEMLQHEHNALLRTVGRLSSDLDILKLHLSPRYFLHMVASSLWWHLYGRFTKRGKVA